MVRGLWNVGPVEVSVSNKRGGCVEQRMQLVTFIEEFGVEMRCWDGMCGDTEESVLLLTFAATAWLALA